MKLITIIAIVALAAAVYHAIGETYRRQFDRWSEDQRVAYARGVQDGLETAAVWTQMRKGHWQVIETFRRPLASTPEQLADRLFDRYEPTMTGRILRELKDD